MRKQLLRLILIYAKLLTAQRIAAGGGYMAGSAFDVCLTHLSVLLFFFCFFFVNDGKT